MIRIAILTLLIFGSAPLAAAAQSYAGFYVGVQAGYEFNSFDGEDILTDPDGLIDDLTPQSVDDFSYSVVAGYLVPLPLGLRAGVELEYSRSAGSVIFDEFDDPSLATVSSFEFETGDTFTASLRLGTRGLGFGLLYAEAGYVTGDFNAGLSRLDVDGYRLAGGFEFPIFLSLKGRIEAGFTDFGDLDEEFAISETINSPLDASVERVDVRAGLVFYF